VSASLFGNKKEKSQTMPFELDWLKEVKVKDITLKRPHGQSGVVVLSSDMTVSDALNALVEQEILSAPVWDQNLNSFVANLDMRDIVNLISSSFHRHEDFEPKKLIQAMSQDEQFTRKPIKEVFKFRSDFPFFAVTEETSIYDVMKQMVETGDKAHRRALVFADTNTRDLKGLKSIISQAAIINLIGTHKAKLGAAVNMTVADLSHLDWELSKSQVISIQGSSNMIEGFAIMGEKNISGLAVVDEHGQLLGTVGSRDVKGLITNHRLDLTRLRLTVREYINYIRMLSVDEKHPAISVKKTDSFATLIGKISSTHVHRIFVIDDKNFPVGVISIIDLLRILMHTQ